MTSTELITSPETSVTVSTKDELYTVAGHIAHAADSVEWFMEGAFGQG